MKNLKALVLNSKTLKFEEVVIDNENGIVSYEFLKERLGLIEHLAGYNKTFDEHSISIWCNEEFRLNDNWEEDIDIAIIKNNQIIEVLAGTLVFCKDDYSNGETYGLTDEEIEIVKNELSREVMVSVNRIVRPALLLDYKG